jgi:microcompartment protein CcmL/EutN
MTTETQDIFNAIDFGIEVQAFITSKVGQYLIKRADADVVTALEGLKEVNPSDEREIRSLQTTIKRAESVQYWMAEAIQEGLNAEKLVTESES